jgi:hypothetical protein
MFSAPNFQNPEAGPLPRKNSYTGGKLPGWITPLPASALIAGLRILGVEEGLPPLPDLEFAIYEKVRPDKAAAALAAVLLTLAQGSSRPAIWDEPTLRSSRVGCGSIASLSGRLLLARSGRSCAKKHFVPDKG